LFENEVPEISERIVQVMQVAREPGGRAKIAVSSKDPDVDPVGACVGMKGRRVQAVVQELRGEKIDIVTWSPDSAKFICNALAPAEITRVIVDEDNHSMEVVVPDDQLSLAIGKRGQNVRLAAKLTGWRLDVVGETKYNEALKDGYKSLLDLEGVGEKTATELYDADYRSARDVAVSTVEDLMVVKGISEEKAEALIAEANLHLHAKPKDDATKETKQDDVQELETGKAEEDAVSRDEPHLGEVSEAGASDADETEQPVTKISTDES